MCNGAEFTCTICGREITALWKSCVPFPALSNHVENSRRANELTAPRAMQPAACRHKKIEKDSHLCDICQPKERRQEERRKNSAPRRMSVGFGKALDMITNKKYDRLADENKN